MGYYREKAFRRGDGLSARKFNALADAARIGSSGLPRDAIVSNIFGVLTRRQGPDPVTAVSAGLSPCQVYLKGGTTSGSSTAQCNRTYRIYNLSGTFLASGLSPLQPRQNWGKLICRTSGSASGSPNWTRIGMCFSYLSGETTVYKLWDAGEASFIYKADG